MEWPLVTVFTLIYNTNPRYIIEAIESVRDNAYPNLQHIIIDDGSPNPEPKQVVKQWIAENNYPCEFYEHEVNYGICRTLNHVLELAKGKYLIGCCDDIILPTRIKHDVRVLESEYENIAFVSTVSQFITKDSVLLPNFFPVYNFELEKADIWPLLFTSSPFSAPSTTIRVDALRQVGGYSTEYIFEDYAMWFELLSSGYSFRFIPEIHTYYRVYDSSISFTRRSEIIIDSVKLQMAFARSEEDFETIKKNILNYFLTIDDYQTLGVIMKSYLKRKYYLEFRVVILMYSLRVPFRIVRFFLSKWLSVKYLIKKMT